MMTSEFFSEGTEYGACMPFPSMYAMDREHVQQLVQSRFQPLKRTYAIGLMLALSRPRRDYDLRRPQRRQNYSAHCVINTRKPPDRITHTGNALTPSLSSLKLWNLRKNRA